MNKLNLGCGFHYSVQSDWVNLDFQSTGSGVIAYNLRLGIPFENSSFRLVYHSHVLEHFSKDEGEYFIQECYRVLDKGGILRIAVPDLEVIATNYLRYLHESMKNPENELVKTNYEWTLLEMYDQATRDRSGGKMKEYLSKETIANEQFVLDRIGEEAASIRKQCKAADAKNITEVKLHRRKKFVSSLKKSIRQKVLKFFKVDEAALLLGQFRLSGEVHLYMYDRFSLSELLRKSGFTDIVIRDAFTSYDRDWQQYQLDSISGVIRKPDSLFIEARKAEMK